MQPILHFFPQRRGPQCPLDNLVQLQSFAGNAIDSDAVCNIVIYGHRKRIRSLKNHADTASKMNHVHLVRINIFAIQFDLAFEARARNEIVHPIQRPEECRFAAARWAD